MIHSLSVILALLAMHVLSVNATAVTTVNLEASERQVNTPSEILIAPNPTRRSLRGVFIICERHGSGPEARLFTSTVAKKLDIDLFLDCSSTQVRGDNGPSDDFNHAKLWPLNGMEFDELISYRERQNSCNTGGVRVVRTNQDNSKTELYRCPAPYESHTVAFRVNL